MPDDEIVDVDYVGKEHRDRFAHFHACRALARKDGHALLEREGARRVLGVAGTLNVSCHLSHYPDDRASSS